VVVLVVPGIDAKKFDDCVEGLIADLDILACGYLWVAKKVSWGSVENNHCGVVEHVQVKDE
jgi:hypothetical protein